MKSIILNNLTKKYKDKIVVNNISFDVNEGEIFSILGTNGSGKTTTIKMLTTLILPSSGSALINGFDIINDNMEIKKIINISPQETAIAPNLTVYENLDFMVGIYNIRNRQKKINELIEMFKLDEVKNQKTKTLSGGWQRKLSIAISLINEPKILFLDEPTLGLDVISRKELWKIINNLKGKTTIILTTHYMEEAEKLSDRIAVLHKGNLVAIGTSNELVKKTNTKNFEDAFVSLVGGDELL